LFDMCFVEKLMHVCMHAVRAWPKALTFELCARLRATQLIPETTSYLRCLDMSLHFHTQAHTAPFVSHTPHRQYDYLDVAFSGAVTVLLREGKRLE